MALIDYVNKYARERKWTHTTARHFCLRWQVPWSVFFSLFHFVCTFHLLCPRQPHLSVGLHSNMCIHRKTTTAQLHSAHSFDLIQLPLVLHAPGGCDRANGQSVRSVYTLDISDGQRRSLMSRFCTCRHGMPTPPSPWLAGKVANYFNTFYRSLTDASIGVRSVFECGVGSLSNRWHRESCIRDRY